MAGLAWAAISSFSLKLPQARAAIEARLSRIADGPVRVNGSARFTLLPRARIVLDNVQLTAEEHDLSIDIEQVEADFSVLDALFGQVELRRVTLLRPEIARSEMAGNAISQDASAGPSPTSTVPAMMNDASAVSSLTDRMLLRFDGLRELRVRDGLLRWPDRAGGISNANLTFTWTDRAQPARLEGSYVWNGEPTEIDATVERPLDFLSGREAPLRLTLEAPTLEVRFNGRGSAGDRLSLDGTLDLAAPSVSRAARWLGPPRTDLPDFGAFRLSTRLRVIGDRIGLGDTDLTLGGNRARGALELTLSREKRSLLAGTLAFDELDFGTFGRVIAPVPQTVLDLQRPVRLGFLRELDMDIRLSARQARMDRIALQEVAATVKVSAGTALLDIGDMAVMGGRGQASLRLDAGSGRRPRATLDARMREIRLNELTTSGLVPLPLSGGTANVAVGVDLPAASWGEALAGARSRIEMDARSGSVVGFSQQMMREAGTRPFQADAKGAVEPFETLKLGVTGLGPRLRIETLDLHLTGGEIAAAGRYDLRDQGTFLRGAFDPARIEASDRADAFIPSKPIPFTIEGEWPKPTMTVEPPARAN